MAELQGSVPMDDLHGPGGSTMGMGVASTPATNPMAEPATSTPAAVSGTHASIGGGAAPLANGNADASAAGSHVGSPQGDGVASSVAGSTTAEGGAAAAAAAATAAGAAAGQGAAGVSGQAVAGLGAGATDRPRASLPGRAFLRLGVWQWAMNDVSGVEGCLGCFVLLLRVVCAWALQ